MGVSPLRQRFRRTADGIVAELRLASLCGDRGKLCAEVVASVVLAVYLADVFSLEERWRVALSAYALIRANLAVVFQRCLERLAGTIIGPFSGLLLAALIFPGSWLAIVALALVSGLGVYCMLGSLYAYSWILETVTALMVLGDAGRVVSPINLAIDRALDVAVGVLAAATVSAASFSIERLLRSGGSSAGPSFSTARGTHDPLALPIVSHPRSSRLWQALQGTVDIALIGLVNHFHALPNFAQSMVSVVAVLLVPLSILTEGYGMAAVHMRMFGMLLRRVACGAAVTADRRRPFALPGRLGRRGLAGSTYPVGICRGELHRNPIRRWVYHDFRTGSRMVDRRVRRFAAAYWNHRRIDRSRCHDGSLRDLSQWIGEDEKFAIQTYQTSPTTRHGRSSQRDLANSHQSGWRVR
jgi:hypothetical protein